MNDTLKPQGKSRFLCFHLFSLRYVFGARFSLFNLRGWLLPPLVSQAQTATVTAVYGADTTVHCVSATLFKLGTGLTRGLNIGGHLGFSLPVVAMS